MQHVVTMHQPWCTGTVVIGDEISIRSCVTLHVRVTTKPARACVLHGCIIIVIFMTLWRDWLSSSHVLAYAVESGTDSTFRCGISRLLWNGYCRNYSLHVVLLGALSTWINPNVYAQHSICELQAMGNVKLRAYSRTCFLLFTWQPSEQGSSNWTVTI